ncbi:MAG: stage V sporulation protein T [Clostridia bacterium]|nr:stage V sporulation protein T [Clostridia bacterium]
MRATGIVRRIDDLGRVVIPKEIRRTMRIREGDPLEIFTEKDGEVIFKKYSPIGELGTFAAQYADTLAKTSGHAICITDKDTVIAVGGIPKREINDKRISPELEQIMNEKNPVLFQPGDQNRTSVVDESDKYVVGMAVPIISEGDSIGSVVFFGTDQIPQLSDTEDKLAKTAASFLGKQMED